MHCDFPPDGPRLEPAHMLLVFSRGHIALQLVFSGEGIKTLTNEPKGVCDSEGNSF